VDNIPQIRLPLFVNHSCKETPSDIATYSSGREVFALNTAVENTRGDIIAFTDDDVLVGRIGVALTSGFGEYDCVGVAGECRFWNSPKPAWLTVDGRIA